MEDGIQGERHAVRCQTQTSTYNNDAHRVRPNRKTMRWGLTEGGGGPPLVGRVASEEESSKTLGPVDNHYRSPLPLRLFAVVWWFHSALAGYSAVEAKGWKGAVVSRRRQLVGQVTSGFADRFRIIVLRFLVHTFAHSSGIGRSLWQPAEEWTIRTEGVGVGAVLWLFYDHTKQHIGGRRSFTGVSLFMEYSLLSLLLLPPRSSRSSLLLSAAIDQLSCKPSG